MSNSADKLKALEDLGREFVPADFTRLSEGEALYMRWKFSAAAEMKTAIKRFADAHPDIDCSKLTKRAEDWLNVPIPEGPRVWRCNECGSPEFTDAVSEGALEHLNCSQCGGWDFSLTAKMT
jgi:hypothetical protein